MVVKRKDTGNKQYSVKVRSARKMLWAKDAARTPPAGRDKIIKFTVVGKASNKHFSEVADQLFVAGSGKSRAGIFVNDADRSIKEIGISGKGLREYFSPYPYYAEWVGKGKIIVKKKGKRN
jgi:hypothetical protein